MIIARTISEMRSHWSPSIGFVPTMGAFHEGHLSLMRTAREENEKVAISIFVNPTQFGQGEDFERYPRPFERDAELAEKSGVDIIFAPSVEEVYPRRSTTVSVSDVTERWEGAYRPGHFTGVATVVAKLFHIVRPSIAYFGLKDLQQCLVIERMVQDLNIPVELSFQQTVREADGLAMSSRNAYLSEESRKIAPSLRQELLKVQRVAETEPARVDQQIAESIVTLNTVGFNVDYLEWVELEMLSPTRESGLRSAVIAAAKLGSTRLIDNITINL